MAIKAIVTDRELRNKITGIDLLVPDFQELPQKHARSLFVYHVIVVTRLFYYKSKAHKESDVVQFMLSKTFEEFEELYLKLSARFPSVVFPELPRKPLMSSSGLARERLSCMDAVLKLVAKTQKLCCSPMVIEFLKGVSKKPDAKSGDVPVTEQPVQAQEASSAESEPSRQEPAAFEEVDLFSTPSKPTPVSQARLSDEEQPSPTQDLRGSLVVTAGASSIFDDSDRGDANVVVEDDLFIPSEAKNPDFGKKYELDPESEILNVSEKVDDLLALTEISERRKSIQSKPSLSAKPKLPPKTSLENDKSPPASQPAVTTRVDIFGRKLSIRTSEDSVDTLDDIFGKSKSGSLFVNDVEDDLFTKSKAVDVSSMNEHDILKYIEQQRKV